MAEYKNLKGVLSFRSYLQSKLMPFVCEFKNSVIASLALNLLHRITEERIKR